MMRKNIGVLSFGCCRNLVDTETILSLLRDKGYRIVELNRAKIAIVNTCAFIKKAVEESTEAIKELISLKKEGKIDKIIVYGCLVERYKDRLLLSLEGIDAMVGRISLNHSLRKYFITPKHFAYLKISEGCNNFCSFCVIPHIKGRYQSRPVESIIEEAKLLDKRGVKEINLIGQDITLYGKDISPHLDLVTLLKEILRNTCNISWIRLLYLYPHRITDELLQLINNEPRICKYMDLPLQHINDRILKLMNRETGSADIFNLIKRIREKVSSVFIRTTLMVGFPTETDEEFEELVDFVKRVKFERLGVFIYSKESQTPAAKMRYQIPYLVKQKRFNRLMQVQQEISAQINSKFMGKILEVLIEERHDEYCYLGRTMYDAPEVDGTVWVKSNFPLEIGSFAKVRIIDTLEYDLVGEYIG
ncbi:MAG: 30S ribosomal protein S12 methylthiotransferase RimO [Candidatus Omnitrophica bacterium]|nr:30S ribosomal protein S12 methylthiotransferase RimO [Candidatus Omnitrophota bacterium]